MLKCESLARYVYSSKTAKAALIAMLLAAPASACVWHDHGATVIKRGK